MQYMTKEDIPDRVFGHGISEARRFADAAVAEFWESNSEVAMISDLPEGASLEKVRNAMQSAIHANDDARGRVKMMSRKPNLYLVRD